MHSVSVLLATAALAVVSATPMGNVTTVTQIRALADDGSQWTLEDGKDYQGYDLTNMRGANANACTASCVATAGCRAFTWTDWQGGTCWLKTARGNVVAHSGATSGVLTPVGPSNQCELTQGVDIVGNDAGSMLASDASLCCAQCSRKPGCAAYTWTSYNGGMCWFKSAVGELKPNAGAVTGRVTGSRADHIQYSIRSGAIPSRSVNLGGWLVSEYWMSKTSPAWQDVDYDTAMSGEYITMQKIGKDKGTRQFEAHRASWITEQDIREIRDVGLNMVRVPVGFWIVDEIQGVEPTAISSVYARGSLKYLDKLINDWAVKYNVAVMLSLHSHQGSQNGNDHSAPQKLWSVDWSKTPDNYANSVRFATTLAARYKDAPAFLGIGLMNEPTNVDFEMAKRYYLEAYDKIRATGNDCILAVAPQLWAQSKESLPDFMRWPQYTNVWMEWHVYYKWGYENQNEYQILDAVRHFRDGHFDGWPGNYVFMGEWSLGNPDEKLFKDRGLMKQFASLQLQQYSEAHAGWAFWSWHHDDEKLPGTISGWSLRQLLREGIMTVPN